MSDTLLGVLLESSLRVSILALLVGGLLTICRTRTASAVRHAAWTAVLVAMLAMPILPSIVPSIAVPVPIPVGVPWQPVNEPLPLASSVAPIPSRTVMASETQAIPTFGSNGSSALALSWPIILLVLYGAGVIVFVSRLLLGV